MPLATNEIQAADPGGLFRGWDLGVVPPVRRRRTVFLPGKARCAVCGCSITDRQWNLFRTCDFWKCRTQHRRHRREIQKEDEKRHRLRQEKFNNRVRLLREKVADVLGIDGPERFVHAVIPALQRPVIPLPEERRSALGDHLGGLIAEAHEKRIDTPGNSVHESEAAVEKSGGSSLLPVAVQACAMCQGYCCVNGADQAYLDLEAILRFWEKHPKLEATGVVAFFLSHVEAYTYKDSCIYHGVNGCSLPRDVRSGTCNGFECNGMKQLIDRLTGPGPHRAFLIAAGKNQVVRYDFVHL